MKKVSRNWTPQEDRALIATMASANAKKLKWEEVADLMNRHSSKSQKTGKQCRERWHNQLAPQLNNNSKWTDEENKILFREHARLGNKWAKIAQHLQGRTDNCVKNHFYSTLRRGMRKVNISILANKKQKSSMKEFKPQVLTKILIVADGDPEKKLTAKIQALELSRMIKEILIRISLRQEESDEEAEIGKVVKMIMEFNKNCKKRKGKKKGPTNSKQQIDSSEGENNAVEGEELEEEQDRSQNKKQTSKIKNPQKQEDEKVAKNDQDRLKTKELIRKCSLQSMGSMEEKFSKMNRHNEVKDFMKNSGYQGFGNLMLNQEMGADTWKKNSGFGIFGEQGELNKQKGMINQEMLQSNDFGLYLSGEKERPMTMDNWSPGVGHLFRTTSITPSPYTPLQPFHGSNFKNFKQGFLPSQSEEDE